MNRNSRPLQIENLGCYGKLPISREFIVEDSHSLSASGFDRWVSEGVGLVKARLGPDFDQRISSFPRYRFYWGGDDHKLVGVISPSEDEAGRKHPFALFASLSGKHHSALASALQAWSLQEHLATLYDSLVTATTPADLRESLRAAHLELSTGSEEAHDEYQRFLAERPGDAHWRDLAEPGAADGRYTVLQALVETLEPLGRNQSRAFRGGIRYPLAGKGPGQSALESCFWLDLTERCLGRPLASAWYLRSPAEPATDNRNFYLFLSQPSGNHWISLVDPQAELESISYLDRPYGTDPPADRMDPDLRIVLESESTTLGDYVDWASGS